MKNSTVSPDWWKGICWKSGSASWSCMAERTCSSGHTGSARYS